MNHSSKPVTIALGAALASSLMIAPLANANSNPFAMTPVAGSARLAAADTMDTHMPAGATKGSKAGEGMCGMKQLDTNGDGKVSKEEFTAHMESMFAMADTNKDGSLEKEELEKMREGKCGGKMGGDGMSGMHHMHKEKSEP